MGFSFLFYYSKVNKTQKKTANHKKPHTYIVCMNIKGDNLKPNKTSPFHASSIFWQRVRRLYDGSNHSQQSLADQIGVDRKTINRLLSGSTYRDMIALLYDFSHACGVTPDVLFDVSKNLPKTPLTGISCIDRMLLTTHNCETVGHIESYHSFVHDDYLMYRGQDEEFAGASSEWRPTEGISYERELELNLASAKSNNTKRRSKIVKAYLAGEQVVVVYDVTIYDATTKVDRQKTRFIDHFELEKSLEEYRNNARLTPKIVKRHWAEIKAD